MKQNEKANPAAGQPGGSLLLKTPQELKIIMDPLRQKILHCMELAGVPLTAKKLADALGIAPSSAKHHLKQLESIGVVRVDHQQSIHGILATYYALACDQVGIDVAQGGTGSEARLLMEDRLRLAMEGFWRSAGAGVPQPGAPDLSIGVVHATAEEIEALLATLDAFAAAHRAPAANTQPYQYVRAVYSTAEGAPDAQR